MERSELISNPMECVKVPDVQIKENFFDDINFIIEQSQKVKYFSDKELSFETGNLNSWPGVRSAAFDQSPPLQDLVTYQVNKKFNIGKVSPVYFFHKRTKDDNQRDWIHKDASPLALIVYLSKTNLKSGTTFFTESHEQIILDVGFVQNRAILFNGSMPHASKLNYGMGEDCRLTLNGFFYNDSYLAKKAL